jgi:hypothetical protein
VAAAVAENSSLPHKQSVAPGEIPFGATFYLLAWLRPLPYNRRNTGNLMFNMYWWSFSAACLSVEKSEKRRFFVVFRGNNAVKQLPY